MSWSKVSLGEVVSFFGGGTPVKSNSNYWGGNIPWATVKDINGSSLDSTFNSITEDGLENSGSWLVPAGTVVIPTRMALGKAVVTTLPVAINQDLKAVVPKDSLNSRFLFHYLQSISNKIQQLGAGTTVQGITLEKLNSLEIPLPPLIEQKRIASILDKVDVLRIQRQESIQLREDLTRSIFFEMFVKNDESKNWKLKTVELIAKKEKGSIRTGPFGSQLLHSEFLDKGIPVLGIDNAVKNRFEWGQPRFISLDKYQELKRYKVFPGDLVITIMGTLGRCAIIPDDINEAINSKHLCCITLDQEKCLPEYLHACLLYHPDVLRQMNMRTKGTVMPGLNLNIIKELEIKLAPINLQHKFKQFTIASNVVRANLESSQVQLEILFRSLQSKAFRGDLDLTKFIFFDESISIIPASVQKNISFKGRYKSPGYFSAPPDIEKEMVMLVERLDEGPSDSIPWSESFFKYRTLSQVLIPPFNFDEIWEAVEYDMQEADYEIVKSKVFEYLDEGILIQKFDEDRKEVVFFQRT